MRSPNIRYVPAIDHLRGFAALLIVLYHGVTIIGYESRFDTAFAFDHWLVAHDPLQSLVIEGHTAVALFMVLSGFIFTFGADDRPVRYGPFLRNRILRIYPLVVFLVIVGIVAGNRVTPWQLLTTLLFVPGRLALGAYSAIFWTLGLECQFYLVFPLLHRLLIRGGAAALVGLVGALVAGLAIAVARGVDPLWLSYFTIFGRLDQFLIGMLAARFVVARGMAWRSGLQWAFFPAAVLTMLLLFGFNRLGGWPVDTWWKILWPPVEAFAWALVVVTWLALAERLPTFVSAVLAAFGAISYSVYLLHFPLIHAYLARCAAGGPITDRPARRALETTVLVILPVVTVLATLTYHLVERPFLRLRGRYVSARRQPAAEG